MKTAEDETVERACALMAKIDEVAKLTPHERSMIRFLVTDSLLSENMRGYQQAATAAMRIMKGGK